MASLDKGKLISRLGYIAYFNERVWTNIYNTAGNNIYHGGSSNITLSQDKITKVSMDASGKATKTGEESIVIKGSPKYGHTARAGANTTSGYVYLDKPNAVQTAHLKTLNANDKQYFTMSEETLDAKATTMGYPTQLAVADVLYSCCFDVIRRLISIRPFTATWQHESSVAGQGFTERFNNGGYSYGVFVDNPVKNNALENWSGSGTLHQGGALSRWQVTLGGNISSLKLTETSVARVGVYKGDKATANRTVDMVTKFWEAWTTRCKEKNKFDYKFFSCHLNCHSSCHSSCHGSRSRR